MAPPNKPVAVTSSSVSTSNSSTGKNVEVCGVGRIEFDSHSQATLDEYLNREVNKAWKKWAAGLVASDVFAARAFGIFLNGTQDGNSVKHLDEKSLSDLVELANDSRDPVAYSIAYKACNDDNTGTAMPDICSSISAERWAEVDPDNAVPLLLLALKQEKNGKVSDATRTLQTASTAPRMDSYNEALLSTVNWLKPSDISPIVLNQIETTLIGIEAAMPEEYLGAVNHFCVTSNSGISKNIRTDSCDKLAELMVERSDSILELAIGRRLGELSGWPKARIDRLKQLQSAMVYASIPPPPSSLDCKSFEKINSYYLRRAELGERGAAEFYIAHSGKNINELAHPMNTTNSN